MAIDLNCASTEVIIGEIQVLLEGYGAEAFEYEIYKPPRKGVEAKFWCTVGEVVIGEPEFRPTFIASLMHEIGKLTKDRITSFPWPSGIAGEVFEDEQWP